MQKIYKENLISSPCFESSGVRLEDGIGLDGKQKKFLKIYGTAIVCDEPGINGRSYPKKILEKEVERLDTDMIPKGRLAAELNHPRLTDKGDGKDFSVFEMNLMKTCARIEELYFNGNRLFCKMVVADETIPGKNLAGLLKIGYTPGYSLRGAGSVIDTGNGYFEVTDDYHLITIDVVGNPSFDNEALISYKFENSIEQNNLNKHILTESVNNARLEFMKNRELSQSKQLMAGYNKFNTSVLESTLIKYNNTFWSK